jgi:hypothetical protein
MLQQLIFFALPRFSAADLKKSKHYAHNAVGIAAIYLIEDFDRLECAGPTVFPTKTKRFDANRDSKLWRILFLNETTEHEIFTESCIFFLSKVEIS